MTYFTKFLGAATALALSAGAATKAEISAGASVTPRLALCLAP